MLKWEWYTDTNTKVVFIHCLLKANFEEKEWRGMLIERGQFVATISSFAGEVNLTPAQVRISLEKLKSTGEIAIKTTNKFSVITISNYESYQSVGSKQQQTKKQSNLTQNSKQLLHNNLILNFDNTEEKKENISISNDIDIQKNPSLYDNEDFQPQIIKTEDDVLRERFEVLQGWLKDTCPTVCKVERQLTFEQFKSLMSLYTAKEIAKVLEKLDEWPDYPKKRSTVYRSALDELKSMYGERTATMG